MLAGRVTLRVGKREQGSALLEGLIAIVIFSFGVLGLVGLQASTMRVTTQSKQRIDASTVSNQRIALMWMDRNNLSGYSEADTPVSGLPGGKRTTVVAGDQVTVTVTWQMPGEASVNTFSTISRINGN